MCFYNFGEENFLKVTAFITFPIPMMVLFETHQRFKGHLLNELRVSFNDVFIGLTSEIRKSVERRLNEFKK